MNNKEKTIKDYIVNELFFGDGADLTYDKLLLGDVIDSMGLQMLIPFLETEFNVSIPDMELLPENFESINAIAELIQKIG